MHGASTVAKHRVKIKWQGKIQWHDFKFWHDFYNCMLYKIVNTIVDIQRHFISYIHMLILNG